MPRQASEEAGSPAVHVLQQVVSLKEVLARTNGKAKSEQGPHNNPVQLGEEFEVGPPVLDKTPVGVKDQEVSEAEAHEEDDPVRVDNDPTRDYHNCTERFPVRGVIALQQDEGVGEKSNWAQSTWGRGWGEVGVRGVQEHCLPVEPSKDQALGQL